MSSRSLDSLVGDSRKRRETFGSTGKTAESSARNECMKLSEVLRKQKQSKQIVVCCMFCMLCVGNIETVPPTLQKKNRMLFCSLQEMHCSTIIYKIVLISMKGKFNMYKNTPNNTYENKTVY